MDLKRFLFTFSAAGCIGCVTLFALLASVSLSAQEKRASKAICLTRNVPTETEAASFELLSTELQDALYVGNGRQNLYGTAPVCLFTDIASLSKWPMSLPASGIKLVQIKITNADDLQQPISLQHFANYPDLKFIHILSEIETSETAVRELLQNVPQTAIVILTIDKPS